MGEKFKEMKRRSQKLGDKIWRKTSEIEIWDRNGRNEFTEEKIEGVKLWE